MFKIYWFVWVKDRSPKLFQIPFLFQATFFRQHHVDTKDILQKYKSRAAQLYRDKLHHLATQAMRLHGTKVLY